MDKEIKKKGSPSLCFVRTTEKQRAAHEEPSGRVRELKSRGARAVRIRYEMKPNGRPTPKDPRPANYRMIARKEMKREKILSNVSG